MKMIPAVFGLAALLNLSCLGAEDALERGFTAPPDATKPRCYWYWMNGNISKEGITRDLEAMARVGIGEGYIGIIEGGGEVKALTDGWWGLIEHAIREGGRTGVDIGLFNSPGWSQSGGPWVKPEQSMRYVVLPETKLTGPQHFAGRLPVPAGTLQDVAVLAFPAPAHDADTAAAKGAKETREAKAVHIAVPQPFVARSVTVHPVKQIHVSCTLQVSDDGTTFRPVRTFPIDRHNLGVAVGPVPLAPITVSFPAVTGRHFRLEFSSACEPGTIHVSAAARLENFSEKQLAKVFQDPQPPFDFYQWPNQTEPDAAGLTVDPARVIDLSSKLSADGTLVWDVPAGEWIVLRTAMRSTGTKNGPAPPEATGPEVDKMNRDALKGHFDAYIGHLLKRMPAADRKAFKHVVADSYEMGPQNWTDGLAQDFRKRYGYDPLKFLPAMTGRIVGSADQSNRFLWDLRRLVADRVAMDYVGALRDLCHEHGLRMWLENYGHWGFPGEFLQYGGACDELSGEFWATGDLGAIELRDAASAAHIYGMPQVFAEAFTGGPLFTSTPWSLKRRGDWAFCEGINQFVLHVNIHQPWEDRRPGMSAWFGTEFNRHNTWFEQSKSWIDYLRRCHFLLQQGTYVADVAYFIGEDAPKMSGLAKPEIPPGYSYDFINAEVILNRLRVKDGRYVLPDGMSYRLLVLPESETMRPEVLAKIRDLVREGGAIMGEPPVRSPSLEDFPKCDEAVAKSASGLWAAGGAGRGRVFHTGELAPVLAELGRMPDLANVNHKKILFFHRRTADAEVYFLSNQEAAAVDIAPEFRVIGRAPELWHPDDGSMERLAVYQPKETSTRVPIHLDAHGSVFVVFRDALPARQVTLVSRQGETLVDAAVSAGEALKSAPTKPGTFTLAAWVNPADDTTLIAERADGIAGLADKHNDVIFPPHGDTFSKEGQHAGCGFAVGRNGVTVFEHGARYFVPILNHAVPVTDWTHVAIVYDDGQPTLYLNGVKVHTGLKSTRVVHPGSADAGGRSFRGKCGPIEHLDQALSAAQVAALMKRMPRGGPASSLPAIRVARGSKGAVEAIVSVPGTYELRLSDGTTVKAEAGALRAPQALPGPWQLTFPAGYDIRDALKLDQLIAWNDHADPAVKYFSGVATYTTSFTFDLAATPGARFHLDLGEVQSLATVKVNGRAFATLWKPPFVVDVTDALKPGANELEVAVANTWHNRMMGQYRESVALKDFKPWAAVPPKFAASEALHPAGLLGPVCVRETVSIVLP